MDFKKNGITYIFNLFCRPVVITCILSFLGGYLLQSNTWPIGFILIFGSPIIFILCNCLENKYNYILNYNKSNQISTVDQINKKTVSSSISTDPIEMMINLRKNKNQQQLNLNEKSNNIWLTAEEFLLIYQKLPWNIAEPEIESTEWLNQIINAIWKKVQINLDTYLEQTYGTDYNLDNLLGEGNRLAKLQISNASIGKFKR